MDIAKYIGLYLLKNKFCYIHGLGNLALKRRPAGFEQDALTAPQYMVVLNAAGSIDDSLANFIASHEQTSISKAANALREFSADTRVLLDEGKEVAIPGIGHFVKEGGRTAFTTDPALSYTPAPLPTVKIATRQDASFSKPAAQIAQHEVAKPTVQWGKIVLVSLLALAFLACSIWAIRYFYLKSNDGSDKVGKQRTDEFVKDTTGSSASLKADTTPSAAAPTPPVSSVSANGYEVVLATFGTRAEAERRSKKLTAIGKVVSVYAQDSSHVLLLMPVSGPLADSTKMVDSLGALYGNARTGKAYVRLK